jgi:hypothetical protein
MLTRSRIFRVEVLTLVLADECLPSQCRVTVLVVSGWSQHRFEQYLEGIGQPITSPRIETVITQIPH